MRPQMLIDDGYLNTNFTTQHRTVKVGSLKLEPTPTHFEAENFTQIQQSA